MFFIRKLNIPNILLSISRSYHKKLPKGSSAAMNNAYFRFVEGDENFELSFIYAHPLLRINKQFNFSRKRDENVGTLITRITTNVMKVVSKKIKKKGKKDMTVPEENSTSVDVKLVQNGEEISKDAVCVQSINEDVVMCISEDKYKIVINAPWVLTLTLPASILAGFIVYPNKFDGLFLQRNTSKFEWYSTDVDTNDVPTTNWHKVGEGYTYFSTTADIGKKLKVVCTPGNGSEYGPEMEAISSTNVEAGPGFCPFENRHSFTQEYLSGNCFRVVSYNILADLYCDSDFTRTVLHPYCPAYALQHDYRKQLIFKELLGYHSDIMCLQEVDSKVFDLDLVPFLTEYSYEGVFSKKGHTVAEGLACFFRAERFKLIETQRCVLGEEIKNSPIFTSIWNMVCDNEAFVTRLVDRATAAQAVILQSLDNSNEIIIVGNTHLYFHPDADHVRLTQGALVITWLENIIKIFRNKMPEKRISLVLCGDFNSVPSCGIYKLYTTGVAQSDLEDWRSNENEALTGVTIRQSIPLASACGTPEFTNYTVGFADCLDYIFYERNNLKVSQVVPLPSLEELTQHIALPSIVFPSDHIALIADLEFHK